ncbi:HlyD family efflux transporter periplasmic adaptor subunit [Rhodopirellula sp. P2]|uniref:HlyD family efflux transporter periplasmic adaptor subunit n=1 Tax=Rhodopirellula sp. P2 TaxID=2127060 RepID=UPI002367860E|nr:HlyD family efflux transporter periplasmic adaptor subunit [Rhodopirellula sp. P2]WDQ16349.1 HlyD family secretion protein [Rhodopirellula sp. P2]
MNCLLNLMTRAAIAAFCVSLSANSLLALDDAPKDKETEKAAEPLKVQGTFEATQSSELTHGLDQFGALEIKKIVPHGTEVKQGQTVIWFDTESIDKKLSAAEIDIRLARITAADEQFAYDQFVAAQELDRQDAERKRQSAKQAYDNYLQFDRDRKIKSAEFDIEMSKASLENAAEELKQLQQMYDADDLTEESEEIVLKRAKRAVESAQFRLESTEIRSKRIIEQSIPAEDASTEAAWERAQMTYEKTIRDLDSAKKKRDLERRKAADALTEKEANFKDLREQRKSIVIQAPGNGILLYGELSRGALNAKPSPIKAGAKVSTDQVIATLVQPKRMRVRLTLSEADLASIQAGDSCVIKPAIAPKTEVKGSIDSLASVPFMGTKFDATVKITGKLPEAVKPTMTATVELTK